MDALSSLYPKHQIGSDGFQWWIGQIESKKKDDPKRSGRYKVRIVGVHPKTCDFVNSVDLPWAICMMPVTNPHIAGGVASVSDQLEPGVWVIGFFLDVDKQQPVIMGSIGRVAAATAKELESDPTPGESGCKSFTTFLSPNTKNADQTPGTDPGNGSNTGAGHAPTGGTASAGAVGKGEVKIENDVTNFIKAKEGQNSNTNPAGINWCVEVADTCGKEKDLPGTFTRLLGEMLHETQRNGGKLGTYLVGELSGELNDTVTIARGYIDKGIRVVRTLVASIKGFILEKIKAGIKDLTNFLLGVTPTGNSLSPVTKFFNDILAAVGCQMADLGDRLAAFIQDLLFGYLFEIYKAAACQIDALVEGILNKIQSELDKILNQILGPIQAILGSIASAIDIIGDVLAYVMDILGISCSGPPKQCSKTTTVCTNCATEKKEDFLDDLLDKITDELFPVTGEDWSQYTCDDAYTGTTLPNTNTTFVGGIQPFPSDPVITYSINDVVVQEGSVAKFVVTRSGYVDIISSVEYVTSDGTAKEDVDYRKADGILGFVAGETSKTIDIQTFADLEKESPETFYVTIFKDTPQGFTVSAEKNIGKCIIKDSSSPSNVTGDRDGGDDIKNQPFIPPNTFNPNSPLNTNPSPPISDVSDGISGTERDPSKKIPSYLVEADKIFVKEGEFVKFTIKTQNVPDGTTLLYNIFGENITADDILAKSLAGSFTITNNMAQVTVGIAPDADIEFDEILIFGIPGTGAKDSVIILGEIDSLSFEDKLKTLDSSSNIKPKPNNGIPNKPIVGEPITDPGGGIIELPIIDKGDPYTIPPFVIITGNGTAAAAIALLDESGFLSEIRITNPGRKYKLNPPTKAVKECIIDSFTLLNTGRNYTSPPTVYVDGDSSIAEAQINEKGLLISVRIKNRELTFDRYPEVLIIGGGGYGGKAIPSFSCLSPDERVTVGSAKIGTGKYIDCP